MIGHPIGHTRSPMMHGYWLKQYGLDASYGKLDVPPEALAAFIERVRRERLIGANITIPHKMAVMELVDRVDDAGRAMGAVNCIWWEGDTLVGGNTDAMGFIGSLDAAVPGWDAGGGHAVILGAGGAARAAAFGLRGRGLSVALCNRTFATAEALAAHLGKEVGAIESEALAEALGNADVLINATSLGMEGQPPLKLDLAPLRPGAVVCDIVYAPLETGLLRAAKARGLRAVDGLGMLLHQGAEGFRRWFGVTPEISAELRQLLEEDIRATLPGG